MKKIISIVIFLLISTHTAVAVEKMKFKYNFHENLPKKWITEFENIMNIVQEEFPIDENTNCLLYTSPSPRDATLSRMPSSA